MIIISYTLCYKMTSIPLFKAIYTILLENNKYFISSSYNINQSFGEHFAGLGPTSTRLYRPIRIIECHILNPDITLEVLIHKYRSLYGINHVYSDNLVTPLPEKVPEKLPEVSPQPPPSQETSQPNVPDVLPVKLPDNPPIASQEKPKKDKPVKKAKTPIVNPDINTFVPDTKTITISSNEKQEKPVLLKVEKGYSKSYRETLSQTAAQTKSDNTSKGLSDKDLLTKENLERWINDEKRSYVYIAQHLVGCTDKEVSAAAKSFGLSTAFSLRRQMIVARKK